ncbi:MAG: VWA domain-containing protein, partial [Pseudomonadota bacterium]
YIQENTVSDIHFENLGILYLLWLLPLFVGLAVYSNYKKDKALRQFAEVHLLKYINISISQSAGWWKLAIVLCSALFIIIGLTRPAWNPMPKEIEQRGRDIAFVLDVSKSMLAQDLKPNRLERAKLSIRDLVDQLKGDRVGLVAFAGAAVVKCPLTLDYGFFRLMLDDISVESISRGGTLIGDAIRKTMDELFKDSIKKYKDIILITDGEDHDSFPAEAAKEAGDRGVRLIAIGLGDETQGQRIPITNEQGEQTFIQYKGQEVWTKLDADTLRKMANVTPGGKYLNVATGTFDLGSIYQKLVASAEKRELESKTIKRYEEKFQIFFFIALVLLAAETLISEKRKKT